MKILKRSLGIIVFLLPAIVGGIGYMMAGSSLFDAFYLSVSMYLFNANTTDNNLLVELSRWIAPVMTASGLILLLKEILHRVRDSFVSLSNDAVVVYGDAHLASLVAKNEKHVVFSKNGEIKDVKIHYIMFDTEEESLRFYMDNREKLKRYDVYMKLDAINSQQAAVDAVRFFNVNEMIARAFWLENPLADVFEKKQLKIALVGDNLLTEKLLYYGLLNNLYTLDQRIEYHVWGAEEFGCIHANFETMNADSVTYHTESPAKELKQIAECDRVIITEASTTFLDELTQMTKAPIYLYDKNGTFVNAFGYDKIYAFGSLENVLTTENIRTDKSQRFGKEINYIYEVKYGNLQGIAKPEEKNADMEKVWLGLSPFIKSSNIASGDYHTIRLLAMEHKGSYAVDEEVCELEHIRWCRYHYLNHWSFGAGEDGKKDRVRKLHPCLVPFNDLSDVDKQKDKDAIETLLEMMSKI